MVEQHVKTTMWYEVCYAEEHMTKPKGVARKHSRQVFKDLRKMFDREVQRSKWKYVEKQQREIEKGLVWEVSKSAL